MQGYDEQNAVPIFRQESRTAFDVLSPPVARHDFEIGDGLVLRTLIDRCAVSDVLIVSLHGSLPREKYTLPRFERRALFSGGAHPVLYIADPGIERADDMRLGWYVGTEGADPTRASVEVAETVRLALGARHVLYLGTSAGGFAAMQMAAQHRWSGALAFSPQASISRYYAGHRDRFLRNLWPHLGEGVEACESVGPRQSLIERYLGLTSEAAMFWYVQNINDPFHMKNHAAAFADAMGLAPTGYESPDGRWRFTLIDSRQGHGAPTVEVFSEHVGHAVDWLRARGEEGPVAFGGETADRLANVSAGESSP